MTGLPLIADLAESRLHVRAANVTTIGDLVEVRLSALAYRLMQSVRDVLGLKCQGAPRLHT